MNKAQQFIITISSIVIASRFLPHPPNFTAIGAVALFAGALLANRWLKYALPLLLLFITDLILNNVVYAAQLDGFTLFYPGAMFTYVALAFSALIGQLGIKKISVISVGLSGIVSAVGFFLISNLGVFFSSGMYPLNLGGLMSCYAAALPFLDMSIAGNLVYSAILFGAFAYFFQTQLSSEKISSR